MNIFYAFGNFQYLPRKVSVDKELREENLHVLLPRLQMDLLSCATGLDFHSSCRVRRGRIVVQFHLRVHRFLKMVTRVCGSGIATSMPLDRKPIETIINDDFIITTRRTDHVAVRLVQYL